MRSAYPLLALLCACSHVALRSGPDERSTAKKPNIVFFLVDDMGWMDSSVYGSRYYETPNLERLAARGMTFTDAYSASPLCSPTRASLLTGKYPSRLRFTAAWGHLRPLAKRRPYSPSPAPPTMKIVTPRSVFALPREEYTIAEALRDDGYRTAHIGKWHLGREPEFWAREQGFDVAFHGSPDHGPPSYFSPYGFDEGTVSDGPDGEYITDRLTDEALAFLENNRDRAFLLHLWHYGVHGPFGHKPAITERFYGSEDPRGVQGNPVMASMLASIDESLGRVMDKLEELGIADNTIVIFSSDNGGNVDDFIGAHKEYYLALDPGDSGRKRYDEWVRTAGDRPPTNNAPLRKGKSWLYEGGTRVPLVVSWPGVVAPGSSTSDVVTSADFYPTILAMADVERSESQVIDGTSLVPTLLGRPGAEARERRPIFCHFPHRLPNGRPPGVYVRAGRWKLIRWFETDDTHPEKFELYDLANDLGETHNVAADEPEKTSELDRLIDAHLRATDALVPKLNPDYDPDAVEDPEQKRRDHWMWYALHRSRRPNDLARAYSIAARSSRNDAHVPVAALT